MIPLVYWEGSVCLEMDQLITTACLVLIFGEIYDQVRLMLILRVKDFSTGLMPVLTVKPKPSLGRFVPILTFVDNAIGFVFVLGHINLDVGLMGVVRHVDDARMRGDRNQGHRESYAGKCQTYLIKHGLLL